MTRSAYLSLLGRGMRLVVTTDELLDVMVIRNATVGFWIKFADSQKESREQ